MRQYRIVPNTPEDLDLAGPAPAVNGGRAAEARPDEVAAARQRIMECGVASELPDKRRSRRKSRAVTLIPTLCAASSVAMLVADLSAGL